MGNIVGMETFDQFLFDYVQYYKGQLVTSEVRGSVKFLNSFCVLETFIHSLKLHIGATFILKL